MQIHTLAGLLGLASSLLQNRAHVTGQGSFPGAQQWWPCSLTPQSWPRAVCGVSAAVGKTHTLAPTEGQTAEILHRSVWLVVADIFARLSVICWLPTHMYRQIHAWNSKGLAVAQLICSRSYRKPERADSLSVLYACTGSGGTAE